MLNLLRNTVSNFRVSQATEDANNFLAAAGITGQVQSQAIYNLVNDLQTSGLWSKMKAVYPMVTDQRNLLSYTEDFTNGYWIQVGATITANSTIAPNGTTTADTINTTSTGYIYTTGNYNGITQTISYYVKKKTDSIAFIGVYDTVDKGFWFNLDTGVITQTTGTISNQTLTDVGNGWYRASFTFTNGAATTYIPSPGPRVASGSATRGTDLYIWGAQLENGTSVSTYQPILTTPSAFMASQMKYNLKDARDLDAAFRLTWSGGWTYSATGATPNGTNAYADTKFNLLTNLPGYDNSFSVYFRQNLYGTYKVGASGTSYDRGMSAHLGWTNSAGTLYHDNLGRNTMANSAYGTFDAYHISSVTSTSSQKLYRNGVMKLSGAATVGLTQPSINFYFGASNDNGTANYFDPKQIAFGTLSTSLTDQDAQLLNQIVEKYQVALSRGVQAAQSFYYNSAYSNESNTYLYSTQITGTTQVSAINNLINGLKANNLWTKMKAVYPFVTDKWNLLGYTEDFANAYWTKNNSSITSNSTIAPDGTNTADTLIPNAGTNVDNPTVYIISDTASQTRTLSFYAKSAGYSFAYSRVGGSTPVALALFDLANGVVVQTQSPATSASITSVGNGWYRCSMTYPNGLIYAPNIGTCSSTYTISSTGISTTTNGTSGIYIWGAQLEVGSTASPYQAISGTNSYSTIQTTTASQMKFNLVNPQDSDAAFRLAFSGGWTYSTNGAQPNGTNGYADTKLVPSTNLSTSSAHFSKYNRTNDLVGNKVDGSIGGTSTFFFQQNYSAGNGIIGEVASIMSYTPTDTRGLFTSTRTSTSLAKQFRNSNQVASATTTITGMSDRSMFIGARNDATITFYNSYQAAFASIGDGLSDAEVALLNQLVTEYQTTLSRNV